MLTQKSTSLELFFNSLFNLGPLLPGFIFLLHLLTALFVQNCLLICGLEQISYETTKIFTANE
jgi:hypothetical protein